MPFFSFHETGRVLRTGLTLSSSMSMSSWTRVSLLLSESSRARGDSRLSSTSASSSGAIRMV